MWRSNPWSNVVLALLLSACESPTPGSSEVSGDEAAAALRRSPNNPERQRDQPRGDGPAMRDGNDVVVSYPEDLRSLDGTGNNLTNREWGAAGETFLRLVPAAYADGQGAPSGGDRPDPRAISAAALFQSDDAPNSRGASDFVWQWGQFLDHDLDLTPEVSPEERFDIAIPAGDVAFDPRATGTVSLALHRSLYEVVDGVREQVNANTAFIDASNVYGSDSERAAGLRTLDGTGRLRTSAGDLPPFNTGGLDNAAPPGRDAASFFVAGDFRANEQLGLTVMHTVFIREHNRLADELRGELPDASGDEIFERARGLVSAQMQAITYREFLPVLLGPGALPAYRGYQEDTNPGIANVFATASYRMGHTMLSSSLLRIGADGAALDVGPLALADAFFATDELLAHGVDPYLRGLATQQARAVDLQVVDDVRNFLFGPPGAGGFDLTSLNIQRGRDHGLPDFNRVRRAYGLAEARTFADINPDPAVQARLEAAYPSVEVVDPWVGGLAEAPVAGGLVGPTLRAVLADQFRRLRDGDRFWYERYLGDEERAFVDASTLAAIIRRNSGVGSELSSDVFHVP